MCGMELLRKPVPGGVLVLGPQQVMRWMDMAPTLMECTIWQEHYTHNYK